MIKFEQPVIEEKKEEEGQPLLDADGRMHVVLESNIRCIFDPKFDNGNQNISADLANIVKDEKVMACNRILDYCPGYGCIGFDMLALGVTNHIVFVDTDESPILNCLETAKNNSVLFYTTGYGIDTIADLPEEEKYDIVVATLHNQSKEKLQDFFLHIHRYMTKYADIYLVEPNLNAKLKNSDYIELKNVYYVTSFDLQDKTIMHFKLCHDTK